MQPELLLDAKATLGEGPAWDAKTQTLYWVDILERRLHIYNGKDRTIQLKDYIGCVAPCKDGKLILALGFGVVISIEVAKALLRTEAPVRERSLHSPG